MSESDVLAALSRIEKKIDSLGTKSSLTSTTSAADDAWRSIQAFTYFDGSPLLSDPNTRAAVVAYVTEQHTWPEPNAPYGADVAGWVDPKTFASSYVLRLRFLPGELTGFAIPAASQVDLDYLKSLTFDAFVAVFWRTWGGGPSGGDTVPMQPTPQTPKAFSSGL